MTSPDEYGPAGRWITTTTLLDRLGDYANRDAWERFVERFRRPIAAFARETGVEAADCEDVVQETLAAFAQAFRSGQYDRTRGRLSSWLFGIAHRQSMAQRRRAARHPRVPETAGAVAAAAEPAEAIWERLWDRFLLEKGLEIARTEFAPATFRAFELVALEDRAPADAAGALGVPIRTVYNAKHRVAKRVRQVIADLESAGDTRDGMP